jgi:hypothetical protein
MTTPKSRLAHAKSMDLYNFGCAVFAMMCGREDNKVEIKGDKIDIEETKTSPKKNQI